MSHMSYFLKQKTVFLARVSGLVIEVANDSGRLKVLSDKFQQSLIAWMPLEGKFFAEQNYTW